MPNSDSRSKLVFNIKYLSRNNYARSFSAQEHLQENHPHSPKAQRSHNRFLNMKSYSFFPQMPGSPEYNCADMEVPQ